MTANLLIRGMLAGILAGLIAFAFARAFGEPEIERAIAFEELMAAAEPAAAPGTEEPAPVSRDTQAGIGLFTAIVLYSAAMGGIFSLVFAGLYGRAGKFSPRALSLLLGGAAFVAIVLVPDLKYPPNPPAVGDPETIGVRTGLFLITIVVSVVALYLAVAAWRRLVPRLGDWNAAIAAFAGYVVVLAIVLGMLPAINEVPENFPALALYQFRVATIGLQFAIWATIALAFGYLAEQALTASGNYRRLAAARA